MTPPHTTIAQYEIFPAAEGGYRAGFICFAYLVEGAFLRPISGSDFSFQKSEYRVETIDCIKQHDLIQFDITLFRVIDEIEDPLR